MELQLGIGADDLQSVLVQYDLAIAQTLLLQDQWNITYQVIATGGAKYNLRICGAEFQDRQCLEDELAFVDFVTQNGQVRAPTPVRNRKCEFVTILEGSTPRQCCLYEWIEGEPARGRLTPATMRQMGAATACLHAAAQAFRFPLPDDGFRNDYAFDETLVRQHRDWIARKRDLISVERVALLHRAIDYVLEHFKPLEKQRLTYGFIHADLHPGNFILSPGRADVAVIDFDQLGRGHFCYDLAVMMVELVDEGDHSGELWHHFKQGYQEIAALPFAHEEELDPFVMSVHLGFLDWIYNTPTRHVRQRWDARFQAIHEVVRQMLDHVN